LSITNRIREDATHRSPVGKIMREARDQKNLPGNDPGAGDQLSLDFDVNHAVGGAKTVSPRARRHFLDFLGRGNQYLRQEFAKVLLEGDVLTQLILFEPGADKPVAQGGPARSDRLQDMLLRLLKDQLLVQRKKGQSDDDAIKDAKAELAKLLAD